MKTTSQYFLTGLSLTLLALALSPAARADYARAYSQSASPETSHTEWMKWVPDSTRLSVMSLPGTHDTMSLSGGEFIECQDLNLSEQLESGLRYFDIRIRMWDDKFHIVHGISDQYYSFDDVLEACNTFLDAHPSETILLRVDDTGVPDKVGCCIAYNPEDCTLTKEQIFLQKYYTQTNGRKFWKHGESGITNAWTPPTLGEVRGKIALIQPWYSDSGNWYGISWDQFHASDFYNLRTIYDRDEKWESDRSFFDYVDGDRSNFLKKSKVTADGTLLEAPGAPALFYKQGLNGTSEAMGVYPYSAARYSNPRAFKYLFERNQRRTAGIVQADFPGPSLISATIAHNLKYAVSSDRRLIKESFKTIFDDTCYVFEDDDYDDLELNDRAWKLLRWLAHILPWRGSNGGFDVRDHWSVVVKDGDGGFANWAVLPPVNPGIDQTLFEQSDWIEGHSYVAMNALTRALSVRTNDLVSYLTGGATFLLAGHLAVVNAAAVGGDCRNRARAMRNLVTARFPTVHWNVAVSRNEVMGAAFDTYASCITLGTSGSDMFYYYVWAGSVRDNNVYPVLNVGGPYVIGEGRGSDVRFDLSGTYDPDNSGRLTYLKDLNNDGVWESGFYYPIFNAQFTDAERFSIRGIYTVRLGVDDNQSGFFEPEKVVSATTTVTVTNVPSTVILGTATEDVLAGTFLYRQGSFFDPGQNPWTVTVNYGDGSPVATLSHDQFKVFQLSHLYSTAGNRTVTVSVNDGQATTQTSFLVRVLPAGQNWLSVRGTAHPVGEGSPVTLSADFYYPGFGGPPNNEAVRIVWGDGTPDEYPLVNGALGTNRFTTQHVYQNNLADPRSNYTATVHFGNWTQRTFAFNVTNVPPKVISFAYPASIPEGTPFILGYTLNDPGREFWRFVVQWGDGTQTVHLDSRRAGSLDDPHIYTQVGTNTVTIQIQDGDGATTVETRTIRVTDEAPRLIDFYGVEEREGNWVREGTALTVEGYFESYNKAHDQISVQIDWGDGSPVTTAPFSDSFEGEPGRAYFSAPHTYRDNKNKFAERWTATVTITDEEGNQASRTTLLSVGNIPPVVDPVANHAIPDGLALNLSGRITDPGSDTFTGTVNYGDGTGVQSLSINGNFYQLNHAYATGGVYTVTVTVTDDDLAASAPRTIQVLAGPGRNLLVTNTNDSGPGSLRQAVADANTPYPSGTAFPNAYSEIRFAPALSGQTILLTSGQLMSSLRTKIDASSLGAGIIVSGNNASRILEIALGNSVVLDSLHLTAGSSPQGGGAILVGNQARLSLNRCSISNCTTTDRGGGILFFKGAGLTIDHCTVSNCRARNGGGVGFYTTDGKELRVNNSTFTGNSATGSVSSAGGAIFNDSGRLVMYHSTVVSNTAAGATSKGGGIHGFNRATLDLNHSIVAANTAAISANVSGTNSGTRNVLSGDPMLYPLGNYGGPTLTMPPRPGSPAIDAVNSVNTPLPVAPFAYWRLGEEDAGTPQGGSQTTVTSNRYGGALKFNNAVTYSTAVSPTAAGWLDSRLGLQISSGTYGTNSLVADYSGATAITDNFGIELWVKPSDANGTKCLAYNGTTSANGWGLYQFGGTYGARFGGVAFIAQGNAPVALGAWTHLALVRDSGVTKLYLDGVVRATVTATPKVPTGRFAVGASPELLDREFFNGSIDEVRVFTFLPGQFSPDSLSYQPKSLLGYSYAPDSAGGVRWSNDQRGYPRVSGEAADIGAVEIDQRVVRVKDNAGNGSLRQTLAEVAGPGMVTFAPSLSGQTILLTSGQLLLNKHLAIDASGLPGGVTIDGNRASRIFEVPVGINISLNSLTLTNGSAGGSLGGAIYTAGTLSLADCTLVGNSAGQGGAMQLVGGDCSMVNCTVSGNTATGNGGAFDNSFGAGTLALTHCTVFGNSGGGSGAGVANFLRTLALTNTIVAGNPGWEDVFNFGGSTVTLGGANIVPVYGSDGTITGPAPIASAPLLAPLGNYGGRTPTMPPLPGSPAIDAAVGTSFATDQRGAPRPNGPAPDVGSVEAFPFSTIPLVDTDGDGADDRMELGYHGNLTTITASSDGDSDGSFDVAELGNMTNPRDPGDRLRITAFTPAPGFDPLNNPLFDVTVSTFPSLTYGLENSQTLTDFSELSGSLFTATDRSQTLRVLLAQDGDFLRARLANGTGQPFVAKAPLGFCRSPGLSGFLSVVASGAAPFSYTWRRNGAAIPGQAQSTLVMPSLTGADAGNYDVIVANLLGSVTSHVAVVVVGLPVANASFETDTFQEFPGYVFNNQAITGWDALGEHGINPGVNFTPFADQGSIPHGTKVAFLQADGEMSQVVSGFVQGAQYAVQYHANARACCSGTSPSVAVRVGPYIVDAAHLVTPVGGANSYRRSVSDVFTAESTSMELAFIKANPQGGDTSVLIDDVCVFEVPPNTAPTVLNQPLDSSVPAGQAAVFSVRGFGSLPLAYQWFHNNTEIFGATDSTLVIDNAREINQGVYSVRINNGAGTVMSAGVQLSIR